MRGDIERISRTFSLDSKQIEIFKTLCSKAKVTQSQMLDYAIKNILIPQLEKETGLNV
jgi:hypothetical protein